jgi:hypothetical protein
MRIEERAFLSRWGVAQPGRAPGSGHDGEGTDSASLNLKILLLEEISANETYIWRVHVASAQKRLLKPKGQEQVAYGKSEFSKDGRGFYTTTDRESEFRRLPIWIWGLFSPSI